MSGWAAPGKKCVCVKTLTTRANLTGITRVPQIGEVLIVREVFMGVTEELGKIVTLRFEEIVNPVIDTLAGLSERGYQASWFRPLVEEADDVALFAHHLVGQTETA